MNLDQHTAATEDGMAGAVPDKSQLEKYTDFPNEPEINVTVYEVRERLNALRGDQPDSPRTAVASLVHPATR